MNIRVECDRCGAAMHHSGDLTGRSLDVTLTCPDCDAQYACTITQFLPV